MRNSQKLQPAIIQTTGESTVQSGLSKTAIFERQTVEIQGRLFRDPRSLDLVDIERAADLAKEKLQEIEENGKNAYNENKRKQQEMRDERIANEAVAKAQKNQPPA